MTARAPLVKALRTETLHRESRDPRLKRKVGVRQPFSHRFQ